MMYVLHYNIAHTQEHITTMATIFTIIIAMQHVTRAVCL